jgi:hypothetical protein
VTTAECEFLNLYVGRTYDLIGLRLGIPSRQAESAGGAEAELESSFFSLFLFFFDTFAANAGADKSTRLGLRQFVEGGREAVGRCQPGQANAGHGRAAQSVRQLPF